MSDMTDKQLIAEIKKLRQIKPAKTWVSSVKKEILGQETGFTFFPGLYLKPAFATAFGVLLIVGLFGFSQNALPGDLLYSLRKLTDSGQLVFVSDADRPAFELELANDRLNDLALAPAGNLGPTINEFQANVLQAAKQLNRVDATTSDPIIIKKIVAAAKKVEEKKQEVESMGVVVGNEGTDELNIALKIMTESLIADLTNRSLTEDKALNLAQMKEFFEKGQYTQALELYLNNQ